MPKSRRNKKNRRVRAKNDENDGTKKVLEMPAEHGPKAVDEPNKIRMENIKQMDPLRTPSPEEYVSDEIKSIKTTPVNKQRSNRDRKSMYESFNVTNLNILFDSNFIFNRTKSGSDICVNQRDMSLIKRSHSSIPKLHSPGKEKPFRIHQSTQTNTYFEPFLKTCNDIIETPKMSRVYLLHESPLEKSFPIFKNTTKSDFNNSKKNVLYGNEVNINPYLKKDINVNRREGSHGELSFFSPLSQFRSSSTPKFNLNNVSLSDKVIHKEDSIRSLRMHTVSVSRRNSYKSCQKSPSTRINTSFKICNRNRHFSYSLLDISRRSSLDVTSNPLDRLGTCRKFFMRLKQYCRASQNWSARVFETFMHLGIQLKNSLSSLCTSNNDSAIGYHEEASCRCEEYKQKICNLNLKINELSEEVQSIKSLIETHRSYKSDIENFSEELKTIKEDLKQFRELRNELESVKDRISCMQNVAPTPVTHMLLTPLSVPPPPPPPPPPPLPQLTPLHTSSNIKFTKKTSVAKNGKENSRPIISLDDILKVKLKKSSDRNHQTPINRRSTQPVVSMDMLRQVKLRPASRSSIHSVTPDSTSSDLTLSPHSSLCRLLKNECPVSRLKRLRRVGGLSYDSVYRRNMMAKRDRDDS